MAVSAFTVANLKPALNIDNSQRFVFGLEGVPEPLGSMKFDNIYVPTMLAPAQTNLELRNNTLSGYRFIHTTANVDSYGSFKLQKFLAASPTGIDVFTIDDAGLLTFVAPISFSSLSITGDLDMTNHKIINLATPTSANHGATKGYVDTAVSGISGSVVFNGAVTGSGTTGTPIATVLSSNIIAQSAKQIFTFNYPGEFNELVLKNLVSVPESFTKITTMNSNNRGYSFVHYTNESFPETDVFGSFGLNATYDDILYPFYNCDTYTDEDDTRISFLAKTVIISSTSHSGSTNFIFTNGVLIDIGSNKITNVADPVNPQDAATRAFVLSSIASIPSGPVTLTGAVTGSGSVGTPIATTLTDITTSQITDFNPAVSAFSLSSFQPPSSFIDFNDKPLTNVKSLFVNEQINLGGTTGIELVRKLFFYNLTGDDYDISGLGYTNTQGTIYHCPLTKKHSFYAGSISDLALEIYTDRLDMHSHKIVNLLDPTNPQDAATRAYVLANIAAIPAGTVTLGGAVTGSGVVGTTITTTLTPINTSQISNFNAAVTAFRLDQFAAPTAALNINSQSLNNVLGIGIGISAVSNKLTFPDGGNIHTASSFPNDMIFQTSITNARFAFFHSTNPNRSCDIYSTSVVVAPRLDIVSNDFMRFVTWSDRGDFYTQQASSYGIGVGILNAANIFINQIGNTSAAFTWFTGNAANSSTPFSTSSNELMRLTGTGFLGIGTPTPHSPLQFVNAFNNRIITLNETANNVHQYYGFGINSLILRYQIDSTSAAHVFYAGASTTTSNELLRITGTGHLAVAGANSNAPLQFVNQVNNRIITLNETTNNQHQIIGLGVNSNTFRYQVDAITTDYVFYAGTSSSTSNELFRVTGGGNATLTGTMFSLFPTGVAYFESNATTTAVTANTFVKMAGTTTSASLNFFTMPTSNRLLYTGTKTMNFRVSAIVSMSNNVFLGTTMGIAIYKNGSRVLGSSSYSQVAQNTIDNFFTSIPISLATNDYVEVYIVCSNTATVTPTYATLSASIT